MSQKIAPSKSDCSLHLRRFTRPQPYQPTHNIQQLPFPFLNQLQQSYTKCSQKQEEHQNGNEERQYREQMERQCKMRVDSIVKGYEVKISKVQETFQLKERKYIEEIQYLKKQLKQVCNANKNAKVEVVEQHHCNICSNGNIISLMKQMLDNVQNEHKGCITQKSILQIKMQAIEQKQTVLQTERSQLQQRNNKLKQQVQSQKTEKTKIQQLLTIKQLQISNLTGQYKNKQILLKKQILKYQDDIKILQKNKSILQLQKNNTHLFNNSINKNKPTLRQHMRQSWKNDYQQQQKQNIKIPHQIYQQQQFIYQRSLRDKLKMKPDNTIQQPLRYRDQLIATINHDQQIHLPITKQPPHYKQQRIPIHHQQPKPKIHPPKNHLNAHWRYSVDASSNEYFHKYNKSQTPQALLSSSMSDNFDTFRPKFSHQPSNHTKANHLMKYNFLQY